MDENQNRRKEEDLPTTEETNNVKEEKDVAGPSDATLPGAIQSLPKAGLSKSEHSMRQIITTKDVANALKSLSFGTPQQGVINLNVKELKIPIQQGVNNLNMKELKIPMDHAKSTDSTALIDLKAFMASCFKSNKDNPVVFTEIPLQNVNIPTGNEIPAVSNSCNAETECTTIPTLPNEVIVTNNTEPKVSKDKKKSDRPDTGLAQRDSLSSIGSNVCRICMTRGRERLISPCNCKGSLANVHLSCLERWLNQVGRNHCELCGYSYPAIRTPRYTVVQALRLWFGNPRNRSHLQSDCLIFWLLSTVTAGLLAVCIVGTQYFVIEGNKFGKLEAVSRKEEGISHRITETAMDFFMAIVLCGYSVTVYLLWKDHYVMWNRWRRANVNVRLLLAPDTNPVPFAPRPGYRVV